MVNKATSGMLAMLLMLVLFGFNNLSAKAQTASPSEAVITVSGVPTGTQGLAVEVTVDTAVVTLGSASSSVSGALVVTGSMSEGVGLISTSGDLTASFTVTVPFTGVAVGTSMVAVGQVLDMLGGTPITGASAMVDVSSVTVASSSSTTSSSSSSSTGGAGGMLSADTFTVTVTGEAVNATNALNVTVQFSDPAVVSLDTGVTFMGTGATQLLTDVNATTGILTAVWDGTITDGQAVITGMLKAGTMGGTSTISVSKVEASGANDITSAIVATVNPSTVTNSSESSSTSVGSFTFVGPSSVVGPGKAAVAFTATGTPTSFTATLNGSSVTFKSGVGVAIIDLSAMGSQALMLAVMSGSTTTDVDLGSVTITAGSAGKLPKISSARVSNSSSKSTLRILGKKFSKNATSVEIVPTDRESTSLSVKGKVIKGVYDSSECIPNGSFVNVTTGSGTAAKKISVKGSCSNPLVE